MASPQQSTPSARPTRASRHVERASAAQIQRTPARVRRVRKMMLTLDRVRPVIRIAHRVHGVLRINPRMIIDHELVLLLKGSAEIIFDAGAVPLRAGSMILIPPFVEHRFESMRPVEHIAIHFDLNPAIPGTRAESRSGAYAVALSQGQSLPTCRPLAADTLAREQLVRIVAAFASQSAAGAMECSSLLAAVVCRAVASGAVATPSPHAARLQRLTDYIDAHPHEPLDAHRMAEISGLSPSRLRAVFAESMGVSPHRYVLQRRIALARQLLAQDTLTLKQIARDCGFADEFHFSKVFRRFDGLPPSVYRTQAQASRF